MATPDRFLLMSAPMQGLTEAEFRVGHAALPCNSNADITYFTPFVRIESGVPRRRDLRDASFPLGPEPNTIPQIIFRDTDEMTILVETLAELGHRRIDLNLGCPFAPQVKRGRGAGLMANREALRRVSDHMQRWPQLKFSAKIRLGIDDPTEWQAAIDTLDRMPLTHLTVHPRTASQQYRGELDMKQFGELLDATGHNVVFNGNITSPSQIDQLRQEYPKLAGVMAGRGLLMRPTIFAEWLSGDEMPPGERQRLALTLHDNMQHAYAARLCGSKQLLDKMQPLWEHLGHEFDSKAVKRILKSRSLEKYNENVAILRL